MSYQWLNDIVSQIHIYMSAEPDSVQLKVDLSFEVQPIGSMDKEVKQLRNK